MKTKSDLPFALTSFSAYGDGLLVTLRDDVENPIALVNLRTNTEKVMQINKYV